MEKQLTTGSKTDDLPSGNLFQNGIIRNMEAADSYLYANNRKKG